VAGRYFDPLKPEALAQNSADSSPTSVARTNEVGWPRKDQAIHMERAARGLSLCSGHGTHEKEMSESPRFCDGDTFYPPFHFEVTRSLSTGCRMRWLSSDTS
jgi:hypothetical protein